MDAFTDDHDLDSALPNVRRFKDTVHDYMPFGPQVCKVIDTPQFQRLRNIKQLGTSYWVWPSASHNRFEHSLGVAFLSNLMVEHLKKRQPSLCITDRDILCVTLAGLCHDLGHGPFSHVWDAQFIPRAMPNTTWKHEDASEMMFDALIQDNKIDMNPDDVTFVKALIAGDPSRCHNREEKPFLFEIVSNKRNGLDVDKFDYIARDTNAIDLRGNLSISRLIYSARVIDNQICYDIKDANQIYELCYTRFSLHKRIYSHKTAKAVEYMLVDALLAAEPHEKFAMNIFDPKEFLHLTDDIRTRIERSQKPELAEARAIIHRIATRDLYRLVDWKTFHWLWRDAVTSHFTPTKIVDAAKEWAKEQQKAVGGVEIDMALVHELSVDTVIVDTSRMHYGMHDKNPLDSVAFYSKRNPNQCRHAESGDISTLMPETFAEVLLRIYTRDSRFSDLVQHGYNAILPQLPNVHAPTQHVSPEDDEEFSGIPGAAAPPLAVPLSLSSSPSPSPSPPRPHPHPHPRERRTMSRNTSAAGLFLDDPPKENAFAKVSRAAPPASPKRAALTAPDSKRARESDADMGASTSAPGKRRRGAR